MLICIKSKRRRCRDESYLSSEAIQDKVWETHLGGSARWILPCDWLPACSGLASQSSIMSKWNKKRVCSTFVLQHIKDKPFGNKRTRLVRVIKWQVKSRRKGRRTTVPDSSLLSLCVGSSQAVFLSCSRVFSKYEVVRQKQWWSLSNTEPWFQLVLIFCKASLFFFAKIVHSNFVKCLF